MDCFEVQEIKSQKNQTLLNLHGQRLVSYERIWEDKKLDRVRYNNFFEHIECYFRNKDIDIVNAAAFCKTPTITIHRKLVQGAFRIFWLTISESLLHQVSWSVEGLNIFMFNHGLPHSLMEMIKAMEEKQMEILSRADLQKEGSISSNLSLDVLGITEADCNVSYSSEEVQSKLEINSFTPAFTSMMQHPRLSKERRREIKKIFKF